MHKPIRIIFHLDGAGIYWDPNEPIHLDGVLAWCLAPYHTDGDPPGRNEEPIDIPVPLRKWRIGGQWGWHASALFPEGVAGEGLQLFRKRFREDKIDLVRKGTASRVSGAFRDTQLPIPLLLCERMVGYACGDRSSVHRILKRGVHFLGKYATMGKGRVVGVDVEWIDEDWSLVRDGKAQRYLPHPQGRRVVRTRPPYWNTCGAVRCCDVGEPYDIDLIDRKPN